VDAFLKGSMKILNKLNNGYEQFEVLIFENTNNSKFPGESSCFPQLFLLGRTSFQGNTEF
jgi:hypothetical protein